jgi:predicted lipoprotein with Yx(FWY)xxD motif
MFKTLLALTLCTLSFGALAGAPQNAGGKLVDDNGMTLYTFDKDTVPGQSACSGGCAAIWPAALAATADQPHGKFGLIDNAAGRQWTYQGHPLYRYASDLKTGDMSGDNVKSVWHVAKP